MKKSELKAAVNSLCLTEQSKENILNRAKNINSKKECIYMSKKRIATIAVAASFVLGVVAYAASGIITSWSSGSSAIPEYTKLPTEQECIDDIGYSPVLINEFENGYIFDNASILNNALKDAGGNNVEKFKSIDLRYKRGNEEIFISADKYTSDLALEGDVSETINGINIYYNKYKNKFVPGDYQMTDEDKKAEAAGELVFSYGMDEVTITDIQNLYFEKDGIKYTLTQIDATTSVDELISMAGEIINS